MNLFDLTPFTRHYIMSPGDAWIFKMKFWQNITGSSAPLDISSFRIKAKLFQLVDGVWDYYLTVNEANKPLNDASIGNYLYREGNDASGLIFAADWLKADVAEGENDNMLGEGNYMLEFSYNTELAFPKVFARYLVELTRKPREDAPVRIQGIDFFLILRPEIVNNEIFNTIINNKSYLG
jgi:hypothetical protein